MLGRIGHQRIIVSTDFSRNCIEMGELGAAPRRTRARDHRKISGLVPSSTQSHPTFHPHVYRESYNNHDNDDADDNDDNNDDNVDDVGDDDGNDDDDHDVCVCVRVVCAWVVDCA